MRKNVFMSVFAAAAMLLATSCQKEEPGTEVPVSFALTQPGIATKAYSDGLTATRLTYAVYNSIGELVTTNKGDTSNVPSITFTNKTATVNLRLVTGQTYDIIFWADAPNSPYTFYPATKTVEVNYDGATSQDETRDAFFGNASITVEGASNETVTLKRPFAQLNIGTTDAGEAAVTDFAPTQSSVTVSNVYSTINLLTGELGEPTEVNFGMAALPDTDQPYTFPVEGVKYLSMNYLLVPANEDNELVNILFTVSNGTDNIVREFTNVPAQRNFRTNIYGNLLTSQTDYRVIIDEVYDGAHDEAGDGNIILEEGVDLGLSVRWATTNVGATTPEGYGTYYSWADITPESENNSWNWDNYAWYIADGSIDDPLPTEMTQYNEEDGLTQVQPAHDPATVVMGEG